MSIKLTMLSIVLIIIVIVSL